MHSYATDSEERTRITLYLAGLSVVLAWLLSFGLKKASIEMPWWIDAPSVAGFYGLVYKAFDAWLWRLRVLQKTGLVCIPNLNGNWTGELVSSHDGHQKRTSAALVIKQTWTKMLVRLTTEESKSHSLIAGIIVEAVDVPMLSYEYLNEPKANSHYTMQTHRGAASLELKSVDGVDILEGDYYSGRGRQTFGCGRFRKETSNKSGKLSGNRVPTGL